ncbi:major facilitator superfamily protein [Xylariomycetidae sp. FL0641]|nr:major facilitator superfamily protein [Xylariomycetidae sp. FL0641]
MSSDAMAREIESGIAPKNNNVHSVAVPLTSSTARMAADLSTARKLFISATVILLNFNVTLGSSLPSGAGDVLDKHFGVTSELQKPLPVAVFLVGYIFGPIIFAPLSESWGRRPVFLTSFAIYTAFTLGCAFAPNWPSFLFFRFMLGCGAAAPQTVSGGLFCDIYPDLKPRGLAVTMLGLTSNVGPLVGPIISGFTSARSWRWQFWAAAILAGANWPMLLFMPETFAPVLRAQAVKRSKSEGEKSQSSTAPGNLAVTALPTLRDHVRILARPIRILSEPLVFFTDLFILYQYVIFFLYFGAYPVIFQGTYNMSDGVSALMFVPTGIGAVVAIAIFVAWDRYHRKSAARGKAWALQEEYRRLPLACLGGPLFALSEFWLGWAARRGVHWAAPALSGVPLGAGIDLTFLALNNYLTDAYGVYSASALASSVFTRNLLAALLLPLATYPLYRDLGGAARACTLLGGLCLALTPIPFAFIRWGPALRRRSAFCQRLARMKQEQEEEEGQEEAEGETGGNLSERSDRGSDAAPAAAAAAPASGGGGGGGGGSRDETCR